MALTEIQMKEFITGFDASGIKLSDQRMKELSDNATSEQLQAKLSGKSPTQAASGDLSSALSGNTGAVGNTTPKGGSVFAQPGNGSIPDMSKLSDAEKAKIFEQAKQDTLRDQFGIKLDNTTSSMTPEEQAAAEKVVREDRENYGKVKVENDFGDMIKGAKETGKALVKDPLGTAKAMGEGLVDGTKEQYELAGGGAKGVIAATTFLSGAGSIDPETGEKKISTAGVLFAIAPSPKGAGVAGKVVGEAAETTAKRALVKGAETVAKDTAEGATKATNSVAVKLAQRAEVVESVTLSSSERAAAAKAGISYKDALAAKKTITGNVLDQAMQETINGVKPTVENINSSVSGSMENYFKTKQMPEPLKSPTPSEPSKIPEPSKRPESPKPPEKPKPDPNPEPNKGQPTPDNKPGVNGESSNYMRGFGEKGKAQQEMVESIPLETRKWMVENEVQATFLREYLNANQNVLGVSYESMKLQLSKLTPQEAEWFVRNSAKTPTALGKLK